MLKKHINDSRQLFLRPQLWVFCFCSPLVEELVFKNAYYGLWGGLIGSFFFILSHLPNMLYFHRPDLVLTNAMYVTVLSILCLGCNWFFHYSTNLPGILCHALWNYPTYRHLKSASRRQLAPVRSLVVLRRAGICDDFSFSRRERVVLYRVKLDAKKSSRLIPLEPVVFGSGSICLD